MQEKVDGKPQRMVRKQILITVEQEKRLGESAAAASRAESEIMREALDDWLVKQKAEEEDWKTGLRSIAGLWSDYPEAEQRVADLRAGWARKRTRRTGESD